MSGPSVLYAMVRADFLERVRRYSFLLALGLTVFVAYAIYSGLITVRLDTYAGIRNSAWMGSVVSLAASVWLSLIGFYIVKNCIQRDRETRVGQILATTPMSKGFYTLSKALSNFAVLGLMVLILAFAGLAIQLASRTDAHIDLFALLVPILAFGLSAAAVTAALAVLFESLPALRGGVGNVLYFFLWTVLLVFGMSSVTAKLEANRPNPYGDLTGIATIMGQMRARVHQLDPSYTGGATFTVGGLMPSTKTFLWTGIQWSSSIILWRALWFAIAVGLALIAALFFDRFDTARSTLRAGRLRAAWSPVAGESATESLEHPATTITNLTPLRRAVEGRSSRLRFASLARSELRLLLRSHGRWWYLVAGGLLIATIAAPLGTAREILLALAWIWPMLVWSQMGSRETQHDTGSLIFSAPHAAVRQLMAMYAAGIFLAALTGGGLALRMFLANDWPGLFAWAAGALFIPALALACGVLTSSRKPFEALYTAWWYIGPLHHIRNLDFVGTTAQSSTPLAYALAAVLLVTIACLWRRHRLAHT
jgi:hypothetical protein